MRRPRFDLNAIIFKVIQDESRYRVKPKAEACRVTMVTVKDGHCGSVDKDRFVKEVIRPKFLKHFINAMRQRTFMRAKMGNVDQLPVHAPIQEKAVHMPWARFVCSDMEWFPECFF